MLTKHVVISLLYNTWDSWLKMFWSGQKDCPMPIPVPSIGYSTKSIKWMISFKSYATCYICNAKMSLF